MPQRDVEEIIGRLITDSRFRKKVAESPKNTFKEEGYDLTLQELRILASLNYSKLAQASELLDDGIKRFSSE